MTPVLIDNDAVSPSHTELQARLCHAMAEVELPKDTAVDCQLFTMLFIAS